MLRELPGGGHRIVSRLRLGFLAGSVEQGPMEATPCGQKACLPVTDGLFSEETVL